MDAISVWNAMSANNLSQPGLIRTSEQVLDLWWATPKFQLALVPAEMKWGERRGEERREEESSGDWAVPSVYDMLVLKYLPVLGGTDHGSHQGGVSRFITVMGGSLIFSKNHRLQVFEKSEPKNLPVLGIWGKKTRIEEQSSISFRYFKTLKEPVVWWKNHWFFASSLAFIFPGLELRGSIYQILTSSSCMVNIPGLTSKSKKHPTLVHNQSSEKKTQRTGFVV